jgi:integrase
MRLHDLRHTVVTYLIESGLSPKTVQEFVGHTDARFTLKQYAHVVNESKRKSSQVISDLYFGK